MKKKVTDNIIIHELAEKICNHGLAVPAIFALEMIKYVSFLGSQLMVFFGPVVTVFVSGPQYYEIAELLDLTVKEEPFSVDEAIDSEEAFITGAGTLVIPVIRINQSVIANGQPGEITYAIREKYLSIALD